MKKSAFILSGISLTVLMSCGGNKTEENKTGTDSAAVSTTTDTVANTVKDIVRFKFDFAIGNTPSPAEVVNDMASYNLAYNNTFLSNPDKAQGYKTDFSKAINLGIYNLDMAYAIANNEGADVMKYLKTSMVEIDALGMKAAFDQMIGKRTETNINNKDSLLSIIDELYVKGDSYLRTNQRVETATYIFAGSWLEALHLICRTGTEEKDALQKVRAYKHLWEQRFYLKNIIDLLEEFKTNKEATSLKDDLAAIHKEINAIAEPKDIKESNFKAISEKISALREKLTK
ncbi:MAG TPA: hypothetical protein VNZ49_17245 [Bacteroidia bacterium]|jgi:hypothetical protein|nr:hypothetical protein [Bacteroidia bacterium]